MSGLDPSPSLACERGRSIEFDVRATALLCIDFQRDFLAPDGLAASHHANIAPLERAALRAEKVLAAARRGGLFVVHTREIYAPDLADLNSFRRRYDRSIGQPGPLGRFLIRGEQGSEICDSLAPHPGEPVVDKAAFNAFCGTSLDSMLRTRGIETLLLTGVTTQCCIASTLRGAVDIGYRCVVLADACAAYDPEDHEATLRVIYSENHTFGWVSDTARACAAISPADG